jgi:flagellar hook-basal body complex protein FliE
MVASEKASVSFKLLMEIRNKLQEAYQTIMSMQF